MTWPVGVPTPATADATVAVKVTDWPQTDGLTDGATAVVLASWLTTWARLLELLPLKLVSPLYWTMIACVPAAKAEVENEADPSVSVSVSITVPPS